MQDQGRMGRLDLVLWPEVKRYRVLPLFKIFVELPNGVEQSTIGLLRSFCGIELLVHPTFDDGKGTHKPEQIGFTLTISKRNVSDVVAWVFSR